MIPDVNILLARYQFRLSLIIVAGYFGLIVATAMHQLDMSFVREVTPITMLVVMYWFQRQRHQTTIDAETNGNGNHLSTPLPPTQPATPAQP
jgi:hypothetical protein